MAPFVEDIKTLYCNGLTISVAGVDSVLWVDFWLSWQNNLAAHLVGGFKQSMSFAVRIWRGYITHEMSQKCFLESNCKMRTAVILSSVLY